MGHPDSARLMGKLFSGNHLNTDFGYPKGAGNLRLLRMPIDTELGRNHLERSSIFLPVTKNG